MIGITTTTKQISCPKRDCTESVEILGAPKGFDDDAPTVECRCRQRFVVNRIDGLVSAVCHRCGDSFESSQRYHLHRLVTHKEDLRIWGFSPHEDAKKEEGGFVCGHPIDHSDGRITDRCKHYVGQDWKPCYRHNRHGVDM